MIERTAKCPTCHKEFMVKRDGTMRKHRGRAWEARTCPGSGVLVLKAITEFASPDQPAAKGTCTVCARKFAIRRNGSIGYHQHSRYPGKGCFGSDQYPQERIDDPGLYLDLHTIRLRHAAYMENNGELTDEGFNVYAHEAVDRFTQSHTIVDSALTMAVSWLCARPLVGKRTSLTSTAYHGKHVFEELTGQYVTHGEFLLAAKIAQVPMIRQAGYNGAILLVALPDTHLYGGRTR